jgi:hypothetical protein
MLTDYFYFYRTQVVAGFGALLVVLVLAFVLWDDVFGTDPVSQHCMMLDVSRSARTAQDVYSAQARRLVAAQSQRDGGVCALVVKGDPAGESDIRRWYVGAENRGNSSEARLERLDKQQKAAQAIDSMLKNPPQTIGGSALVEGIDILSREVRPGDEIHVFSDGLQDSDNLVLRHLNRQGFSPEAIDAALDNLEQRGFLPSLAGVRVSFETPSYRPGTEKSVVEGPDARRFWEAWGDRVGAEVRWG